jgi:quinol monooxygenase YgiN
MVIVGVWFDVAPEEREAFLEQSVAGMRTSRAEPGNLEYVLAADPLEPGRVVLFERWESQEALDAHLAALATAPAGDSEADRVAPTALSIVVYEVSGERTLV